ncbi:LuxR C-terminal-related transcriptional regulator [Klebsiella sp. I138]|uniref:LuxR C-terminal-related transcriptional regulator n=1 Tax=Klebsiella sp. I138 TaxID=2755385 RepID=UPI003DA7DA11
MIYIMSDEDYFSLGVKSVFNNAGEEVVVLPFASEAWQQQFDVLERGDILLLAVDFMGLARRIFQSLAGREIKICLFINNACGYEYLTGHHGIVSRRIPISMMIAAVHRAVKNNSLLSITEKLTPSERLVMDNLANGVSVSQIAHNLQVTEKKVYSHKTKAIHRMGIYKLKNKAVLIYGCISLNGFEIMLSA